MNIVPFVFCTKNSGNVEDLLAIPYNVTDITKEFLS